MIAAHLNLPQQLDGGLVLRWATPDDIDQVATFNSLVHGSGTDRPALEVATWTRDLMDGRHPHVRAHDFTVVVDPARQVEGRDKIVSSLLLLSQTWSYDGIEFGVGQPEIVGTDPDYRRRGLVRVQMDVVHSLSAARGELAQVITGIPWYYRQFGYEMTVNLSGSRALHWERPGNATTKPALPLTVRRATEADLPLMQILDDAATGAGFLRLVRDDTYRRYRVFGITEGSVHYRHFMMVETEDGAPFGYFAYCTYDKRHEVDEIAVTAGQSLRELVLCVAHFLRDESLALPEDDRRRGNWISFRLGEDHPVYSALERQLGPLSPPYAYYVRVPDLPGFLQHIAPILERNLATSVMAGHSGVLKLNLVRDHLALTFERGRLMGIDAYTPGYFADGDVMLPDLTFLHILFRHRCVRDLNYVRKDCWAGSGQAEILVNVLFPKTPAFVLGYA